MTTYSFFFTLINKIPPSFWGVVVGSFFSIAAVALTNRAADERLRAQLEHERKQKTIDREMTLRKELYLAAAETIDAGISVVLRFADLDLPNDRIGKDYDAKSPAIAKTYIIATAKTTEALANFTGELGAIFLKLSATRLELMREKKQINILDNHIQACFDSQKRYLEMISQHEIDGIVNNPRWQTLLEKIEFEETRINEATTRRDELANSLDWKQLDFMRQCALDAGRLKKLVVPVLAAAREELELPFNEESYLQSFEMNLSKQEIAADEFMQKAEMTISKPVLQAAEQGR